MKVTCLVSGGKDSILTLWIALHQYEVVEILTVRSNCSDSLLFHLPNCQYVAKIAEMLGIRHRDIWVNTCDIKDEINSLKNAFIESNADAVITGGIRSDFQRNKFNRAAIMANMKCFCPLWRLSATRLLSELLNNKFRIIISSVAGMGLGKDLLGKEITKNVINSLRKKVPDSEITIIGEGGEYESFVFDAPYFPSLIQVLESKIIWDEFREEGYFEITKVKLDPK